MTEIQGTAFEDVAFLRKTQHQWLRSLATRNIVLLLGIVLLWGGNWPAMKVAVGEISPLWLSTLRFACGGLCLFPLAALSGQLQWPAKADWPIVVTGALFQMAGFSAFVMIALLSLPPGRSIILAYSTPLWVAPASVLLLRERLGSVAATGVCCGIAGLVLLTGPWDVDWSDPAVTRGIGLLLGAALLWAIYILHVRARPLRTAPLSVAIFQMALATVILAITAYRVEPFPHLPFTNHTLLAVAYIGPLGTAFCFWASLDLGQRLPATTMSIGLLGVPVAGLLFSSSLLHERMNLSSIAGVVLVLLGLFIVSVFNRSRGATVTNAISTRSRHSALRATE
jgi:drug/metabolite transporter (DMT)-like permease